VKVTTVDYHAGGEPFRIVTGGAPALKGKTVLERRRWALENCDEVRKLLVNEPRGHADMYGGFVTPPDDKGADLGVVFFHNAGYSTACGHGTIALVTWAVETGKVKETDPQTRVTIDVPSGRLTAVAKVFGGDVKSVRFRNVPSYVYKRNLKIGRFTVDVAYGGAFYAILPASQAGLKVEARQLPQLIELGRGIKHHIEAELEIRNPDRPEIGGIYGVIFTDGDRNVTVFADGEVDRSPCGSGTSARLALMYATGELKKGETLHHRSIVDTVFKGRVVAEEDWGVITEIEGSAHRTGKHQFLLEDDDELGTGFLLR